MGLSRPGRDARHTPLAVRVAAAVLLAAIGLVVLAGLDVAAHRALSLSSDFNVRGYRGALAGDRVPGEVRIAVLGESTTFGYGVRWQDAVPARLERVLQSRQPAGPPVRVLNLGFNGEGAYSFAFTLADYADLQPDIVVFYTGYNDLLPGNRSLFRHSSPIFTATGYLPMLPVLARARLESWLGEEEDAAVRFDAGGATGATALADLPPDDAPGAWLEYRQWMRAAIERALAGGARVMVAGQPDLGARHRSQQRALAGEVEAAFAGRPVRYVDLADAVDLSDRSLAWDGLHLTPPGNHRIAERMAHALQPWIR